MNIVRYFKNIIAYFTTIHTLKFDQALHTVNYILLTRILNLECLLLLNTRLYKYVTLLKTIIGLLL